MSFSETQQRTNSRTTPANQGLTLSEIVEDFLQIESEPMSIDLLGHKKHICRCRSSKTMIDYFAAKDITYLHQHDALSLEDYPLLRHYVMKRTDEVQRIKRGRKAKPTVEPINVMPA